jgi:carboxymethylenebutenolidase
MTTSTITLTASDGHELAAYESVPDGPILGRMVVIQEIFGVNEHIRDVCDRLASQGVVAVAPAVFDRVERNVELEYNPDGIARGLEIKGQIDWDPVLADTRAALDHLADDGPVGVVGFCWGGSVAWLAGCRIDVLACAVGYYGGQIAEFIDETPKCPTMLHFGEKDTGIPLAAVRQITARHSAVQVFTYPEAEHGFNCDHRGSYHKESADLAESRSLPFYIEKTGA